MTVKADWGAAALADKPEAVTPAAFGPALLGDSPEVRTPVPNSARPPVDLDSPEPVLREWLDELIRREGNLFDCGTTCPLRDLPDSNCSACPVSRAHETDGTLDEMRLTGLCRIGAEQERVLMLLSAQRHGVGRN